MGIVNLLGGNVATIGSQFHYVLADGTQGNGIPQLLPQLMLPWSLPGSDFTLSWDSLRALLPAAFSMAMLGAIESLLCAVVLDGMTGTKHKANSELIGRGWEYGRAVLWRHHRHRRDCPLCRQRPRWRDLSHLGGNSRYPGHSGATGLGPATLSAAAFRDGGATADGGMEYE